MQPPMNSRLVAHVPNGSNTLSYNPSLVAPGRFSEGGIMMPWASNLGTSNRIPHDLNFFSDIYHDNRNGGGFHNQRSMVPDQNGFPGSLDHTIPTTAHHGIPVNIARSIPFRTQDSSHGRHVIHNSPHGDLGNNNRTLQTQAPNLPHGFRSMHSLPGTVLGSINPVQPVAAPNSFHVSRAWNDAPLPLRTGNYSGAKAYSDHMAQAAQAGILRAHGSQIAQAHRGGPAIFRPQQSRAFHSVQQIGPVVYSQRSSAGFPSQNSGAIQSSRQAEALPASRLSYGHVHQNNNYVRSVGSHHTGAPQGQLAHPVNNSHPGAHPFNHSQGQAANSSRHPGNQIGASQGQVADTSLRPGHQSGAPQLQSAPAVILNPLEIYLTSLGSNSSGPFGQHGGRRSRVNQLPRLRERRFFPGGLRSSPNGLAATTFYNFPNLPIELRLMVWNRTIQRGVPRFIFFGYMNLPPAMAQVNVEARGVYKHDCKYYKLADTQRVTIYAPNQDMFLFKKYIPGLRLATPGEWSTVPVEMTKIHDYELDNVSEQYWASQIIQGHQRNLQSGNTKNFTFTYVVFFP